LIVTRDDLAVMKMYDQPNHRGMRVGVMRLTAKRRQPHRFYCLAPSTDSGLTDSVVPSPAAPASPFTAPRLNGSAALLLADALAAAVGMSAASLQPLVEPLGRLPWLGPRRKG
jgi:hypothetical protein